MYEEHGYDGDLRAPEQSSQRGSRDRAFGQRNRDEARFLLRQHLN